jgi:hypothetical protein
MRSSVIEYIAFRRVKDIEQKIRRSLEEKKDLKWLFREPNSKER